MNTSKVNLMLQTAKWIVLVPLLIAAILWVTSGFDLLSGVFLLTSLIVFVPVVIFGASSFLFGYYGIENWTTSTAFVVISGVLVFLLSPFISLSPDPQWLLRPVKLLLLFSVAFGAGYLTRHLILMWQVIGALSIGILFIYIALAGMSQGNYSLISSDGFYTYPSFSQPSDQKQIGAKYYRQKKMCVDPFPARIVGIRYSNDNGELVGWSHGECTSDYLTGIDEGNITTDNSDILLHKNYELSLSSILAPAKNAIRVDREQYSVLMYYEKYRLMRKEIFYFPNGVVNKIVHYRFDVNEIAIENDDQNSSTLGYNEHTFDLLGYQKGEPWFVLDFRQSTGIPDVVHGIGVSFDSLSVHSANKSQRQIIEQMTICDTLRNRLKRENRSYNPFNIFCASSFAPTSNLSIYVDNDSSMREQDFMEDYSFTQLSDVGKMKVVADALALCRLESGMAEPLQDTSCVRIRIKEQGTGKYLGLYLLEDMAISRDLRFCFRYDPMSHTDPKKQADAKRLWKEMKQTIKSNESQTDGY